MFAAGAKGPSQRITTGPTDVCKTPSPGGPVPMPYPNLGMGSQLGGTSTKVKISNKPAATTGSKVNMSSGDEVGSAGGGVVSNKMKGPIEPTKGSSRVKIQGKPGTHHLHPTKQNGGNTVGVQVSPDPPGRVIYMG